MVVFLIRTRFLKLSFAPLGAFEIRMLFRKSCLRFWEPRPSEQGGFRHRSLYGLISRLLPPGKFALPDPDKERPPAKRHPSLTLSRGDPSDKHPRRCLAWQQVASGSIRVPGAVLFRQKKPLVAGKYELLCIACWGTPTRVLQLKWARVHNVPPVPRKKGVCSAGLLALFLCRHKLLLARAKGATVLPLLGKCPPLEESPFFLCIAKGACHAPA